MINKIKYLMDYFKYLDNPIQALKFKFKLIDSCELVFKKSKRKISLNNIWSLNKIMYGFPFLAEERMSEYFRYIEEIDNDSEEYTMYGVKFINIYNTNFLRNAKFKYLVNSEEYFYGDEYNMTSYNGRHVIDIGANNADSTLYFAKNGAEVIGFEPVRHIFELGLKNIDLNKNLKNKIIFINKAVGIKKGKLKLDTPSIESYIDTNTYDIEVTTLPDILNQYEFTPDILKMDCEGCEFEIIEKEDLTMFNDIIFEHHTKYTGKDYKNLIKKLKNDGFKIKTYQSKYNNFEEIGIIHAYK